MRKTILFLAVLAFACIAYMAWPAYDLSQFVRAVERGDATTAAHYVNLARVRTSLIEQITEAYLQRTGARSGPLVHGAVGALADPIVHERAFVLQFRLARWRWQLAAVRVPEPIRLLLADELIKSTKSLQPPPRP